MEMIKKCLIIAFMILLIVAQMGLCFADTDNRNYFYNQSNNNLTSLSITSTISNDIRNDLINNHYVSIISRYSTPKCTLRITFNRLDITFIYNNTNSDYSSSSYNAFSQYVNNYSNTFNFNNLLDVDTSNLNASFSPSNLGSNGFGIECNLRGYIEAKLTLNNDLLGSGLYNTLFERFNVGGFVVNLCNTYFTQNGYTYYCVWSYTSNSGASDVIIQYSFDRIFNNVDGFIIGCGASISCSQFGFNYNTSNVISYTICNRSISLTSGSYDNTGNGNLFSCLINATLLDNSQTNILSFHLTKLSSSGNYSYSFNNNSQTMNLKFYVIPPLFYNNNDYYIQSADNNTDTPLKLQYYDAEWYELHLQIANAFIFFITELPIVSDVTNLIYSIVNLISNAITTLTSFNGFGVLFAFGMFAVILGLFLKIILGSD